MFNLWKYEMDVYLLFDNGMLNGASKDITSNGVRLFSMSVEKIPVASRPGSVYFATSKFDLVSSLPYEVQFGLVRSYIIRSYRRAARTIELVGVGGVGHFIVLWYVGRFGGLMMRPSLSVKRMLSQPLGGSTTVSWGI